MGLSQNLYFMSLVGGTAGLLSWALTKTLLALVDLAGWLDFVSAALLGCFIGALTLAFVDHTAGSQFNWRWVFSGAAIGLMAGLCGEIVSLPIHASLIGPFPVFARSLEWMLVGSFIGLGLGLRWVSVNRMRLAHAFVGGLLGGAVGGVFFASLGSYYPDFSEALGFIVVGLGISFGVAFAPIFLREGLLQFISSSDPRAQSQFGHSRKQWELQEGDVYLVGSENPATSRIYIKDSEIAPLHARVFGKTGRYFLERHPEIRSQSGIARFKLFVRNSDKSYRPVPSAYELKDNDDIVMGGTTLRFLTRKRSK